MQTLEDRVVPAVNVAFTGGVLTLTGSAASEAVTVRAGATYTDVLVAGRFTSRVQGATSNSLSTINFSGGGGTDSLAVSGINLGLTVGLTDVARLSLSSPDTIVTANTGVAFGVSTVTGTLNVTAAGAITQTGKMTITGETTLTATGGNDVTLSTSGNSFGTLVLNAANVTLNETGATDLGTISTGNLTVTSSGAITDSGDLSITGNTSLTSSSSTVTLDQLGSSFGGSTKSVSLKGTDISFRDTNATGTVLGTSKATGTLSLTTAGDVTQTGGVTVTGAATIAAGAGTKQILLNSATLTNNFGSLALTGTTVSITERSTTDLAAVTATTLTVTSNSTITDSDTLVVSGVTSLTSTGGSITLDDIDSTFGSTVTLKGRNIAIIDSDGATELGSASKATGTFAVTTTGTTGVAANDKVTQNGAISSLGRMTVTATGKDITLNTVGNKFGSISVFGKDVNLREADASDLFTSIVTGTFELISGGGVTDSGDLTISGTTSISTAATNKSITLDVATSDFTGALTLSAPKNIAITNTLATNLATVTATTGTLTVISGGDVTDSGVLTVGGRATITATGRDITLDSANNYNSIAFEGRNVLLTESSATDIFTSTATGTFSLTSTGAITDSGTIEVVDNMTLNAAGQNITLDSAASTFGGNLLLTGAAVSVRDSDVIGVSLGNSTVTGLLTITSVGDITDAAATAVSAGTATFNAGTGDITLTKTTLTAATKTLRLTGQEVSVTTTTAIDLGTSTIGGDFYLKTEGVVTQSGIVTVAGASTIDADPPGVLFDITLNMVGNSFTGPIVLIGEDVILRNNRDTFLSTTHTHGSLTIIANGDITNVLLPGPTYGVFDVDGAATFNAGTHSIFLDILNSHSDFAVLPTYIASSTTLIIPTASITLASSITADDIINIAESGSTIPISGTVGGHIVDGDIVTLTINGVNSTGAVSSGAFSINVAGSDLAADVDRTINASVITTGYGVYNATGLDTETYQVDIVAPTVTNVFVNDVLLSDADTGTNKLVVTTDFSEPMNTGVNPTLTFGTSVTGSLTFNSGSWTDNDTYVANYDFADNNVALSSITIDVTGTQDAAFNPQQNYTELAEFSIDTLNPIVNSVTASPTTVVDATVGSGTFTVAVVFNEAMSTGATPTLTFAPTVASTLAFSSGVWTVGNTTYTATYNVSDANIDHNSVTIDVTNAQDAAGNAQQDYTPLNEFDVDTVNPTVTSVSVNDTLLSDADVGTNKLIVTIDFSEPMNTGINPTLTFGAVVTGTLTFNSGSWTDSDTYVANYNVADNNVTLTNVTIDVTGTQDANTNPQQNYAEVAEFSVDTQNPIATSFTRKTPATSPTNADTLVFLATFSEDVTGVAIADFAVTGTTATITSVTQVTPSTYDVTISGGDLADMYGTVGLNLNSPTILDLNGNVLPNNEPATDETYFIDNTTLDVSISGNDLVIEDIDATGKNNVLSLSRVGANLVITDANEQLDSTIVGAVFSNGRKTITVPASALGVGGKIIFKTQGGSDSLSVDVSTDLGFDVDYQGGSGTSDSLTLVADNVTSVTYSMTNANDGSITIVDGGTRIITFTGLEPITDNLNAADRSFTFNGGGESISLVDAAGSAMTIDSDLAEFVTFANPTNSLTINAGTGIDTVTITSVDTAFNAALTINGDGGLDTVNLNSDITFASGKSLIVTAESVAVGANADLTTSGAGVITLTADDVALNATSSLTSASTVTLTQQTASRPINLGTETGGSLSLTEAELDRVTAATVSIGNSSSGTITVSDSITRSAATNVTLVTGGSINFTGASALLDANGGDATLTASSGAITSGTGTTDVRANGVTLAGGASGIGSNSNPLITDATSLTATTSGNGASYLSEIDTVNVGSLSNHTGAINLMSGTFRITGGGINGFSPFFIDSAAVLQLNGTEQYLNSLSGSGQVTNASTTAGILHIYNQTDSTFSGVLGGAGANDNNFSLTTENIGSGGGTITLSGANTYTGTTTVNFRTLKLGNASALGDLSSGTTVASGAVLDLNGQSVGAEAVTLNGTGISSGGALINSSGTAASLSGNITLNNASSIGGSGDATYSGTVNGGVGLTFVGAGTKTFSGIVGGTTAPTSITQDDGTGAVQFMENVSVGSGGATFNANVTLDGLTFTSAGAVTLGNASGDTLTISGAATTVTTTAGSIVLNSTTAANQNFTLTAGGSTSDLTISAGTTGITGASGINIALNADRTVTISENVTATGTGTIAVSGNTNTGARNILVDGGASVSTVNGNLLLDADTGSQFTGSFVGVDVNAAEVKATGNGAVTVHGRGGNHAIDGNQYGVQVRGGGDIIGSLSGLLTVQGTGGASSGAINFQGQRNYGVFTTGAGSTITSLGGNVSVTGNAGGIGANTFFNSGVRLESSSLISAGGSGTVTVVGTGSAEGGSAVGVVVRSTSMITSSGGNVSVTGSGGGASTGDGSQGVNLSLGAEITAGGSGTVTVIGTGGSGSGGSNHGVLITDTSSKITSGGGGVTVTGTAGGGTSTAFHVVTNGSITTATNGGTLTLIGDSMNFDASATVSASSGSSVTLRQKTNGVTIDLGGADAASTLGLTDAELDRVTAGTVYIGDSNSGAMTISAAVSRASGGGLLSLASSGAVTASAGGGITVTGNDLVVRAGGAITLDQGNAVGNFAATTTSGGITYVESSTGGAVNINDVDGVGGVSTAGGNINISTTDGSITVSNTASANDVDANTGTVTLTAGQTGATQRTLTMNNSSVVRGTSGVTFVANDMSIGTTGTSINGGTSTVTLRNEDAGAAIDLGTNTAGQLGLTDTELDRVTAGTVQIGDSNSGTITVSAAITHANHLSLTTGAGITVNQAITMASDKNFSATSTSTTAGISLATSNSDISTSGTGTITVTAARNISLSSGSSLTTVNGSLMVSANQQTTATTGDFKGITVTGGVIESTGSGNVSVSGRGGTSTQFQDGVSLGSSGRIGNTAGTGTVTVTGTAGGLSNDNYGVASTGGAQIVGAAAINVTGFGGGTNDPNSRFNLGVHVDGSGSKIESTGGTVTVTGTGGWSNGGIGSSRGVNVTNNALISALGSGTVSVTGTGGPGTQGANIGVYANGATISTAGGALNITGTGTSTSNSFAIYIDANGSISSNGGALTLTADSMFLNTTSASINSGTGTTSVLAKTSSTLINLGGTDALTGSPLTLGLTDGELDRVTAGTVQIGDASSAAITVSSAITHGNNLSLTTGAGITVNQAVTMANDKNFSATTTSTTAGISLATANSDIAATGAGTITLTAARNVALASGSSLTTVNGNLAVSANQQVTPTTGNFVGVDVNNGLIQATGTGLVTVQGKGGDNSAGSQIGVRVNGGGDIIGGTTGTMSVQGTGGASTGGSNIGVLVDGSGSQITAAGGNVSVVGQGGGIGGALYNYGVHVVNAAQVTAGGSGTVTVQGTAGGATGQENFGVYVQGASSQVTSNGGNVSVTGTGGGTTSLYNYGVRVSSSGVVTAGGSGTVTVQGTGGASSGQENFGVFVDSTGSQITSSGGNVSVTGQGGGTGSSAFNHGVRVYNAGKVTAGGSGTVTVQGTGGATTGQQNFGVYVDVATAQITSSGGNVSVTGQGGGTGTSATNRGVSVNASGVITSGGSGTVTVQGTGGSSTGTQNNGVYVADTGSQITSGGGNVTITGIAGTNPGVAIFADTNGTLTTATNGGTLTLIGDSMTFAASGTISAQSGSSVTLRQRTNGTLINLGGADVLTGSPLTLGLTDAELDRVTAGTVNVGDANSGAITVSAAITHGNNLSLTTGAGITVNDAVTMASDKSFSATTTSTTSGISLATANSDISATGTGTITLTAARNVALVSGSSLSTVNGNLVVSANQQTTATTGNFVGVDVNAGLIQATGSGAVTVQGKGGNDSSGSQIGVQVRGGGDIIGGTGGLLSVEGQGGSSTGIKNNGVVVTDSGSTVTSATVNGSNVKVTGTGGGSGASQENNGVVVISSGRITAGGTGTVTVEGTGGNVSGSFNSGVAVSSTSGPGITSSGGNVSVKGTGGGTGTSSENHGVAVVSAGLISAGGTGTVMVEGFGGNTSGSGSFNIGVVVFSISGTGITSTAGNVSITGTGGGGGTSTNNIGVSIAASSTVSAGGSGSTVTIVGQGGNSTGGGNDGIRINNSTVTSSGGDLFLTGTPGTSSGVGLKIEPSATISTATNGGTVTLIGDSMSIDAAATISAQSGSSVTLRQKTNGVAINLGGADAANTLGLTDAELDRVTAGTINIGNANSGTITVSAAITHGNNLSLTTGAGITVNDAITMANDKNFSATTTSTTAGISLDTTNSDISATGTGTVTLTATRNIALASGSSVTTVNGSLNVNANQQTTPTTGDFFGVDVNGGLIQTTGTGAVTVRGKGGTTTNFQRGVVVQGGGDIIGGTSGVLTVEGTGGAAPGIRNYGVYITDSGSTVTSAGANVSVTGIGDGVLFGGLDSFNAGVRMENSALISAGGTGTVTVVGVGDDTPYSSNYGVLVLTGSIITSNSGSVSVTGTGGGASSQGVYVLSGGSTITSGGGDVTVTGTAPTGIHTAIQVGSGGSITTVTNGGTLTLIGDSMKFDSTVSARSTSSVTLLPKTNGVAINLGDATDSGPGPLNLTDAELDLVTAGTINIGNANSGTITFSADITRAANTNINLTTGSGNNIAFGAFSLNAGSGGDVSLTTSGTGAITTGDNTGTDLTADDVTLNAGSGGIGSTSNFLRLAATTVVATTTSNGSINLAEADSVMIGANDLNAGTGTVTLGGGTFLTTASGSILSPTTVASGATLGGIGSVTDVTTQSGGSVAPGNSPGILSTGNVVLVSGSTFSVEIGGTSPGNTASDHDQLSVTGSVDLGNATLSTAAFSGFVPASGNTYVIVLNDLADAITGTFNGLAEGATISTNFLGSGLTATISYVGGSGNDVVITVS